MFNEPLLDFIDFVYNFFNDTIGHIGDTLAMDILGIAKITGWSKAAWVGRRIFKPAAYVIAAICFVIEFCKLTIKAEMLRWQNIFRCCFLFLIAKAGIDIAGPILLLLYQMCIDWINEITSKTANFASLYIEYEQIIQNMGIGQVLVSLIVMGIPLIMMVICAIVTEVIAMGRCFEITVYYAISPIPLAFLPLADSGQAGRITTKFIFSFIASCFQGVLIMICLLIYSYVAEDIIYSLDSASGVIELWTALWKQLITAILLVFAIVKTSSWASKIFE